MKRVDGPAVVSLYLRRATTATVRAAMGREKMLFMVIVEL
jgi:hypothetical protein